MDPKTVSFHYCCGLWKKNSTSLSLSSKSSSSMAEEEDDHKSSSEAITDRNWSDLTPVCLTAIFLNLPIEERWKVAMRVCRSWFDAAREPSLFESLDLESSFSASGGVRSDVEFWWTPEFERRVDKMVTFAAKCGGGSLWEIRVRHCSDVAVFSVAERCQNLQVLSLRSSQHVTDKSLIKIALACPLLKELDISNCYEISYKSLEILGSNCAKLTVLKRNLLNWLDPSQHTGIVPNDYLNSCPQDGDREAATISNFMSNLKHLELRFSKLTTSGLMLLSEGCKLLEHLDLIGCANLTGRAVEQASANLENLKTLKKPNFYIPRSMFHSERYGHWRLYDERFQTSVFRI